MVGVFSFDELPARMSRLGDGMSIIGTKLVRLAATGIGATVVDTTKVDTGVARSNWRAALSVPASGIIPAYAPGVKLGLGEGANASAAKAQQRQVIGTFDARKHKALVISNFVPHIGVLNNGDSKHAAGNMVQLGLQTGRDIVRQTKKLLQSGTIDITRL